MAQVVFVDRTHMGRRASGIERITEELFSQESLSDFVVDVTTAPKSKMAVVLTQAVGNPLKAMRSPDALWLFPGFPPSPFFWSLKHRSVLYVHDLFLLTRTADLNVTARIYLAPLFRGAIRNFRYFLANSEATARALQHYISPRAHVQLYRPHIRNVFNLDVRREVLQPGAPVVIGAIGTIEPRKNFVLAAEACKILSDMLNRPVELHIIGRRGWGADYESLSQLPHVRLHGFVQDERARDVIGRFDLLLCTSHDEGLCLPLLEVQYAGLPVVAPDQGVFREVLGDSGTMFEKGSASAAALAMHSILRASDWSQRAAEVAGLNLIRWNNLATQDQVAVRELLHRLGRASAQNMADRGDPRPAREHQ